MILLGNRFSDIYNTLFDNSDNLSDFEDFPTASSTGCYLVIADGSDDIMFHKAERRKADPPKRYETSEWSFDDATLTDIPFTAIPLKFLTA